MREKWWCKAQETWNESLVFFSWSGYPRWPGIVVKPRPKSELLKGLGDFYKPDAKVFSETTGTSLRALGKISCNIGHIQYSKFSIQYSVFNIEYSIFAIRLHNF